LIITNVKLGFLIKRVFVFLAQTFFFLNSRKPYPLESVLCGSRWASKTPAVPDSYKKCTPWLELETCYADLKLFAIMLCSLGHFFFLPCDFLTSAKSNLVDQQFIFGNPSLLLIYLLLGLIFKFVLQFFGQKIVKNWDEKI